MIRSVLAVLAGIVVLTVTSFAIEAAADPLMMRVFPHALPDRDAISHNLPASLFMFAYSALCVAAGGYVTAWVARRRPVLHAVIMGAFQMVLTILAMLSLPNVAPLRNWIVSIVLSVPTAWCGGILRARQVNRHASPQEPSRKSVG
jgi:hypothetical protein